MLAACEWKFQVFYILHEPGEDPSLWETSPWNRSVGSLGREKAAGEVGPQRHHCMQSAPHRSWEAAPTSCCLSPRADHPGLHTASLPCLPTPGDKAIDKTKPQFQMQSQVVIHHGWEVALCGSVTALLCPFPVDKRPEPSHSQRRAPSGLGVQCPATFFLPCPQQGCLQLLIFFQLLHWTLVPCWLYQACTYFFK